MGFKLVVGSYILHKVADSAHAAGPEWDNIWEKGVSDNRIANALKGREKEGSPLKPVLASGQEDKPIPIAGVPTKR